MLFRFFPSLFVSKFIPPWYLLAVSSSCSISTIWLYLTIHPLRQVEPFLIYPSRGDGRIVHESVFWFSAAMGDDVVPACLRSLCFHQAPTTNRTSETTRQPSFKSSWSKVWSFLAPAFQKLKSVPTLCSATAFEKVLCCWIPLKALDSCKSFNLYTSLCNKV